LPFDLSRLDILVLDAEASMGIVWGGLLAGLGIRQPMVVQSAAKAWALLQPGGVTRYDVGICRWELPGDPDCANGLEFVRRLRRPAQSPAPFLPALVATPAVTRERLREALDAGVNELLVMPLSSHALAERLREVVERPRKFVRGENYFGPDRRRFARPDYPGPYRRAGEN
jgi:two-component system, chemotaxis family, chemotaxis protein CheY